MSHVDVGRVVELDLFAGSDAAAAPTHLDRRERRVQGNVLAAERVG
jgi:hypothetical protein